MKKIIIIALITFSAGTIFAQNNHTVQQQQEREAWGNFLKAEQAKRDAQQAKIEADALKNKPVETPKTESAHAVETRISYKNSKTEANIPNASQAKTIDKNSTLYIRQDKK